MDNYEGKYIVKDLYYNDSNKKEKEISPINNNSEQVSFNANSKFKNEVDDEKRHYGLVYDVKIDRTKKPNT